MESIIGIVLGCLIIFYSFGLYWLGWKHGFDKCEEEQIKLELLRISLLGRQRLRGRRE